jgi:predicted DNA-binding transcriptional regulator AlpA
MPRELCLPDETLTLLNIDEVRKRISKPPPSAATIRNWTHKGIFPKPQQLGSGDTSPWLWRDVVIDKWIVEWGDRWRK